MQDVCPVDLFCLQTHKILHSIAPLEKWQLKRFQINLQAFDKYVHSMEGMALSSFNHH